MKSFLYSIAEAYVRYEQAGIADYCFIFPNKRSCTFFHHAFAKASRKYERYMPHPATTTISNFIEEFTPGKPADRMEMIFILYQAYCEVIYRQGGETRESQDFAESLDFNKFQRWADIILGDFNDVDMYLVDVDQLFPNLKHYREISANYLDEEVIEEIKKHWKAKNIPEFSDSFWNHIKKPGNSEGDNEDTTGSAVQFFKLWQVMKELYYTFKQKLTQLGLFYPGMAYRYAESEIKKRKRNEFEFKRYIFVGFNMLSQSEENIFQWMKDKPSIPPEDGLFADFYFDNASPAFLMEGNTTANQLNRYSKKFPSLYDCVEQITGFPKIEITGVASKVGQIKIAGAIVGSLYPQNGGYDSNLLRHTAIILPQESFAQGVISSLPKWINPINITMGYRLRESKVATLVGNIVSMHLRSRKNKGNQPTFFYEDVITVLTHPILRQLYPTECNRIIYEINTNRWYNIEANRLTEQYSNLTPLFKYVENTGSADEVFAYFEQLFNWLLKSWTPNDKPTQANEFIDSDGVIIENAEPVKAGAMIDRMLTRAYLRGISRLKHLISTYLPNKGVYLADTTLFHMLERIVGGETINFEGRPLDGLQVMGVLEARNLDFDNIILPSMNEKIFPRKHFQKSFIPPNLRSSYGMATQEHQESIYSYYFFRMISRARRVFLLYDARTQGVGSGQMSRYLLQLLYLYKPKNITSRILGYSFDADRSEPPRVRKTAEILAELDRYRSAENPRNLSASAINTYINCPLSFYLTYIAGYKREDEFHDYMDESTFGTIIHGILEDLYKNEKKQHNNQHITKDIILRIIDEEVQLQRTIVSRINQHYLRRNEKDFNTPLTGDAKIFGNIMLQYIKLTLNRDIEAGEFDFEDGEFKGQIPLKVVGSDKSNSMVINFTYTIDRVDDFYKDSNSTAPIKRIIDYKTGEDATQISEIKDMFEARNTSTNRAKAMLQLFLYAQAYAQQTGRDVPIQPWIYSIRKVATERFTPLRISEKYTNQSGGTSSRKVDIEDYRDYLPEFNDLLLDVLSDLFNPEIPFAAADDDHACTYCKFTEICRKQQASSF